MSNLDIGKVPWSNSDLKKKLKEFSELYEHRPIANNEFGMRSPHLFACYFLLQWFGFKTVVESGVGWGQGTWMIENALPNARIISIEPVLTQRKYISPRAQYKTVDVQKLDLTALNRDTTLILFDDHSNALERVRWMEAKGFKHAIFEDNYPSCWGDCYSLKKIFMKGGVGAVKWKQEDLDYIQKTLKIYYEFPPVFKTHTTRSGVSWNEPAFPTKEPLLDMASQVDFLRCYLNEAKSYTWIAYVQV